MAFTGSTVTGRKVMESSSASNLKKLQTPIWKCNRPRMRRCLQQPWTELQRFSRILVQESVLDKFLDIELGQKKGATLYQATLR
ncbi:hypothetical protein VTP01DRAFT_2424 [Rhizomucor pusillus]|uniref:uncharacterized protein n=1 Tax=Rhizomucor pusillus TaxID=4840 RepID=UPI003742EB8C